MIKVTIYTTPTCVYCKTTKEFFAQHGIAYEEVNAAADVAAARYIVEKTGQMGVPVTIIEKDGQEHVVLGFDKAKLSSLLSVA